MLERHLDLEIPVTRDQWEQVARRAEALGPEDAGFSWNEKEFDRIHVHFRDEDVPSLWRDYVMPEGLYGDSEREIAEFRFNDGRPYAQIDAPATVDEPAVNSVEEQAMRLQAEKWVRDKWQELMRESGLHYERGHIPTS